MSERANLTGHNTNESSRVEMMQQLKVSKMTAFCKASFGLSPKTKVKYFNHSLLPTTLPIRVAEEDTFTLLNTACLLSLQHTSIYLVPLKNRETSTLLSFTIVCDSTQYIY